jgi:diaminohydroxyphosphoribosylaminopyrimidine deaminase/5-amino-6-(5-phosphoribosylamino)uracil reductase
MNASDIDTFHMKTALTLAARGLGLVAPNPAVGCVIVGADGGVVGRGWTQPGGRPHAEAEAIGRAGDQCVGATAYVTLEPCNHHGKTPPCSESLINAGIKRVIIACEDPDPRVAGKGIKHLKAAGLEIIQGILEAEAQALNAGFMSRLSRRRPVFTLKSATTLDGRIATRAGHSKWITGMEARTAGHMLRARHDAIMVSIGTALNDDPSLSCRLPDMERFSPIRIIVDSSFQLPTSSTMVKTAADILTIIITGEGADEDKIKEFKNRSVKIMEVKASTSGHPDPYSIAEALAGEGLNSVLIEGGGKLAGAFMQAKLIDRLAWFHAAKLFGDDGIASVAAYGVEFLPDATSFTRNSLRICGEDVFETYERK